MSHEKKTEQTTVLYSLCSGYNYYVPVQASRQSYRVFGKDKRVIRHVKTGETFYITEFPENFDGQDALREWVELIRKPVDLKHYIWPVDIILCDDQPGDPRYALVFPMRALPVYDTVSTLLANDINLGWNMPRVQQLVSNLLDAWSGFSASNYAYHEFSDGNMFYRKETNEIMFDFSFSTHRADSLYSSRRVDAGRVTPDYADSYFYAEDRGNLMDLASDYYSMAVILFKLMIGRLPYQGAVMEHEPNSTEREHAEWLNVYHKNTFFIFDEEDETNHIGGETGFAKDEIFVERWNELPEHIRNMFHNVFQTANVMRSTVRLIFYSPQEWREALFGGMKKVPLVYRNPDPQAVFTGDTPAGEQNRLAFPPVGTVDVLVSTDLSASGDNADENWETVQIPGGELQEFLDLLETGPEE